LKLDLLPRLTRLELDLLYLVNWLELDLLYRLTRLELELSPRMDRLELVSWLYHFHNLSARGRSPLVHNNPLCMDSCHHNHHTRSKHKREISVDIMR